MTANSIPPALDPKVNQAKPTAAPEPTDMWVGRTLKKYAIVSRLGRGGMGVVYLAEDTILKRVVAIKMISRTMTDEPNAIRRLHREARAAAQLQHANVASLYDIDEDLGVHFLVMEFVAGPSAQQLIEKGGMPWRAATQIIADACRGLAAAHAAALIHRDIKPANILLSQSGQVKLGDFGLAKEISGKESAITAGNQVLGTPQYMSPEQGQNGELDERSDVYSLGATYYALLTGEPPYTGKNHYNVVYAHAAMPIPDPRVKSPQMPDESVAIVRRAMAKRRGDRYASAVEMLAELESVLGPTREELASLAGQFVLPQLTLTTLLKQRGKSSRLHGDFDSEDQSGKPIRNDNATLRSQHVRAGQVLGRFLIRRELGRDGLNVVYLAHDPELGRDVALKVPRVNTLAASNKRKRFHRETHAAAGLDHPNIVPVYEAGVVGTICYTVSAYCPGPTLAAWFRQHPELVPARMAAQFAATLADGVQYAHARDIWHRDLKPANILLVSDPSIRTEEDATNTDNESSTEIVPTESGPLASLSLYIPRICDFGLARNLDDADNLGGSGVIGTPSYMAPEQADGASNQISESVDIHALGAILYELLTGRPPFQGESAPDVLQHVRQNEPVPPSLIRPHLPPDLETICLKCLQKEPAQRYSSAADLAADLKRFLSGEPITARPTQVRQSIGKWARRHPAVAAAIVLAALMTTVCIPFMTWLWQDALASRGQLELALEAEETQGKKTLAALEETKLVLKTETTHRTLAEFNLTAMRIALAQREWLAANVGQAGKLLDECPIHHRQWEWHYLKRLCDADNDQEAVTHRNVAKGFAFSPDSRHLATVGIIDKYQHLLKIHDLAKGQLAALPLATPLGVNRAYYSPDGAKLAVAGKGGARMWDLAKMQPIMDFAADTGVILHVDFHPEGVMYATATSRPTIVTVRDARTNQSRITLKGHASAVRSLHYSPDRKRIITTSADKTAIVWDAVTGELLNSLDRHDNVDIADAVFSSNGKKIAIAGHDRTVRIWDAVSGKLVNTLIGHSAAVNAVAFSRDDQRLASASSDGAVKLWDPATGHEVLTLHKRPSDIPALLPIPSSLCFSPDGLRLAAWYSDSTIRIWDATPLARK